MQQLEMSAVPRVQDEVLEGLKGLTRPQVAPTDAAEPRPLPQFRRQIVWFNALGFLTLHLLAVYGVYVGSTQAKLATLFWSK